MKKVKIGIKFKILLGVVLLLAICTGFNLVYSYNLFVEDKTSYIYESTLKKVESIADQINYNAEDIKTRTEFSSLLLSNPNINLEKLINNQKQYVMAGIVSFNDNNPTILKEFSNHKNIAIYGNKLGLSENEFASEIISKIKSNRLDTNKTWVFSPKGRYKFLCYITKSFDGKDYIFSITDLNDIIENFEKEKNYTNKVISFNNRKEVSENTELLSFLDYNKNKKGVLTTTIKEKEVLLAYAYVSKTLVVVSYIDREHAFSITQFLILKTSLFAGLLMAIAVILGIYFSSSITFPITTLTKKALKIADGDFESDIEIKSNDELNVLGNTFNYMSKEILALLKNKEDLIAQLEDYSKNLEKMVEQRTIELKNANDFMALMVNSLDQGLLVFDQDLNCNPMFTKACEPIFGVSPLDKSLPEVLGNDTEEYVQSLKQWANVAFNELIPFESAINLGPRNKITGIDFNDPNYKFVQLDYYPMRDSEDKVANIVLIATDKTNEVQATEKAKEKEQYVSMILKILNNKTQFESFINEVEEIFHQFHTAYSKEKKTVSFDLCMMLFHTLNGGFGIYSLTKLQLQARGYETEITNIKDTIQNPADYISKLEANIAALKNEFHHFMVELDGLIGTKFAANQSFTEIPRSKILELKPLVLSTNNKKLINEYFENFVKVPVINYFKAYDDLCKTTAVKINKDFKGLKFVNADLKVEAEPLQEFFNVLVHLFRNCLDHGIEDSYTRAEKGKSPDGHIGVSFELVNSNDQHFLSVVIEDDGAGIDPNRIRARYNQLRPNEDISHLSNKEVIYKIFDPFFSTRDEVSALSGRGVGMSAIKEVVDRLNGTLEIESHVGHGSSFTFLIPLQS